MCSSGHTAWLFSSWLYNAYLLNVVVIITQSLDLAEGYIGQRLEGMQSLHQKAGACPFVCLCCLHINFCYQRLSAGAE